MYLQQTALVQINKEITKHKKGRYKCLSAAEILLQKCWSSLQKKKSNNKNLHETTSSVEDTSIIVHLI